MFRSTFQKIVYACLIVGGTQVYADKATQSHKVTVTRDNFGVPHLKGGTLKEIFKTIGYVHAQDRLWQIFLTTIAANGRLAEFFGPGTNDIFIESDVFQHQINYTNAEVREQVKNLFTDNTRLVIGQFVKGINERVAEVNADFNIMPYELKALGFSPLNPLPPFTEPDIIRATQFFLQSFSPTSVPMFQLTNLSDFLVLLNTVGGSAIEAFMIFGDIDPTPQLVKSQSTIIKDFDLKCKKGQPANSALATGMGSMSDPTLTGKAADAKAIAQRILRVKEEQKKYTPKVGSNGEAIGPSKSASGNAMLRCAIQPNFNHPSDFYQVIVDSDVANFHADILSPGIAPLAVGVYQQHGLTVQVGQLPSNDFLFESVKNIKSARTVTIKVLGQPNIKLKVFRSTSGGWVIQRPLSTDPTMQLTLRSVFIGRQLQAFNSIVEQSFVTSFDDFKKTMLNFNFQSDIALFEGQYADTDGNYAAFHTGGWTKLPPQLDRRFPQGISFNPAPDNRDYNYCQITQKPLLNANGNDGFYAGWNSLYKQKSEASADTTTGIGLSRVHWIDEFINEKEVLTFEDMEDLSFRQAVANDIHAFSNTTPDQQADFFTPLFKQRFFKAVRENPTPDRLQAINLLANYRGRWFQGDRAEVAKTTDVSDKFILASLWQTIMMETVLNPFLFGTSRQVCPPSSPCTPLPVSTSPQYWAQLNLLARILGTNCDNRVMFPGWLVPQPPIDQVIVNSLDQAIATLGGFGARPWGKDKRPLYAFINPVIFQVTGQPSEVMLNFNASGVYFIAEFTKDKGVLMKSIIPLGESGEVLGIPPGPPLYQPHNFDQQPIFEKFRLRNLPPVKM